MGNCSWEIIRLYSFILEGWKVIDSKDIIVSGEYFFRFTLDPPNIETDDTCYSDIDLILKNNNKQNHYLKKIIKWAEQCQLKRLWRKRIAR
jgi:hypothetical protein